MSLSNRRAQHLLPAQPPALTQWLLLTGDKMRIAILDQISGVIWSSHGEVHTRLLDDARTELGIRGPLVSERLTSGEFAGELLIDGRLLTGYTPSDDPHKFYGRAAAEKLVNGEPQFGLTHDRLPLPRR